MLNAAGRLCLREERKMVDALALAFASKLDDEAAGSLFGSERLDSELTKRSVVSCEIDCGVDLFDYATTCKGKRQNDRRDRRRRLLRDRPPAPRPPNSPVPQTLETPFIYPRLNCGENGDVRYM
jgi:hypothetical protein